MCSSALEAVVADMIEGNKAQNAIGIVEKRRDAPNKLTSRLTTPASCSGVASPTLNNLLDSVSKTVF